MENIIHIPRQEDSLAECGIETGLGWSAGVIDYYMKDLCFECIRKHPKVVQLEAAVKYAKALCYKHSNGDDACHCEFYDAALGVSEKEHVQHKPECWKNQARSYLGVGGRLASCTCGLEDE